MKIGLASDHGGYELKEHIREHLEKKGIEYIDYGTNSEESVDYPDYGRKAGEAIMSGEVDRAIVVCGTEIGKSVV